MKWFFYGVRAFLWAGRHGFHVQGYSLIKTEEFLDCPTCGERFY